MKNISILLIIIVALLISSNVSYSENNVPANESYYDKLISLTNSKYLKPMPQSTDIDINVVDIKEGIIGGIKLGDSIDKLVKVWGKPNEIDIDNMQDTIKLGMGDSDFTFRDNKLISGSIHCVTLPNMHTSNGLTFKSTIADITKVMGEPFKTIATSKCYKIDNNYLTMSFMHDDSAGEEKLIAITIGTPESINY